jgi:hypothetical protein
MERKPLSFPLTITVTNGSGSVATPVNSAIADAGGYLRQVIVKAPFDTATFSFRIVNANGHNIYKRTDQVGEIIEDMQTPMPKGNYICYIENASHNGAYSLEIIYAEVY